MSGQALSGDTPTTSGAVRHKRHYSESVLDLIAAGFLAPGQELFPTRLGKTDRATLLASGHLRIGAQEFASLSAAAKAVSGNTSEPGWEFWAAEVDGRKTTLFALRERLNKGSA